MKKEIKKQIDSELFAASESVLKSHNPKATLEIKKHLKDASKKITRKFAKAIRAIEKSNGQSNNTSSAKVKAGGRRKITPLAKSTVKPRAKSSRKRTSNRK